MKESSITYSIEKYTSPLSHRWNAFLPEAGNAPFLFHRDFIEYHRDRFSDFSLLLYKKQKLLALFPAHREGEKLYSHQGLSYGGLLLHTRCRFKEHCELFYQLTKYLHEEGIRELYIRDLPLIYRQPVTMETDLLYAWLQADLLRADIYSYLDMSRLTPPNRNRRRALKKAAAHAVKVTESEDYETFWNNLLIPNLAQRFGVKPTHSLEEIRQLHKRFPRAIQLFAACENGLMKAGAVLFVMKNVVHFQYSAGADDRAENGALELLFHTIIGHYTQKRYISFGTSSNKENDTVNRGLLYWKESYGAHHIAQRFYKINTENYMLLEGRFT